jgi:hypothetical protein
VASTCRLRSCDLRGRRRCFGDGRELALGRDADFAGGRGKHHSVGQLPHLLMFALFVGLGVLLRKRAEVHKRLMLLASVAIVGPALGRFPLWPIFAGGLDAARNYAIGGLLLLLASLIVYDIVTRRRPHPATWLGAIAIVVSLAVSVALGVTGIGFAILQRVFHGA